MLPDWGSAEAYPSTKTDLEAAPKPIFSAVLELSPYSGIFYL